MLNVILKITHSQKKTENQNIVANGRLSKATWCYRYLNFTVQ